MPYETTVFVWDMSTHAVEFVQAEKWVGLVSRLWKASALKSDSQQKKQGITMYLCKLGNMEQPSFLLQDRKINTSYS